MTSNKYRGHCGACGKPLAPGQGILEHRPGLRAYLLWCRECFDRSDSSGAEDRQAGDRAYEDACWEAVSWRR